MRGVELSTTRRLQLRGVPRRYELDDPALGEIARIVHEADLEDERYDAPEARGLDVLSAASRSSHDDARLLAITAPLFDGLYEFRERALMLGREPA